MKKVAFSILTVVAMAFAVGACDMGLSSLKGTDGGVSQENVTASEMPPLEMESPSEVWTDSQGSSLEDSSENSGSNAPEASEDNSAGDSGSNTDSGASDSESGAPDEDDAYLFNAFTPQEQELFLTYVGEIIPFLPNNEYYVEGYYEETDYENGLCFYAIGNTAMEFIFYRAMYSDYTLTDIYEDDLGDTWYTYEKGSLVVDMCYYYDEGEYQLVVYVYSTDMDNTDIPEDGEGDDADNEDDGTGVRTVDFTQATNVKDVTDLGYYKDGCPTTGKVKVLVVPVEFSDVTAVSKGYTLDKLHAVFNGGANATTYHSVAEYYDISSDGQLDLEFVVLDSWFRPKRTSDYYSRATMDYYGEQMAIGDQKIMDEALDYLEGLMDLSEFDSDNNGVIDAVVMINTLEIDDNKDFNWAYRYWNFYTNNSGNYYEYDGVSANDYIWASYKFMFREYDEFGNYSYDYSIINPYTYIHEFAHVLGADDYYDTAYKNEPMGGYDMMDSMLGDHNPFTKFNYGWLTTARLITAEESVTLTLESFTETGDAVIIANDWDDKLGAYQEYYVVVYYTNTGLNSGEGGYFLEDGIMVYHVNAALTGETYDDGVSYDLAYNNTDASDAYGTKYNLIELVQSANGDYIWGEYDSMSANERTDDGQKISYVFTVNRLKENGATVTFYKNN